tara:strand:- start:321 stop:737 length:417 start_codon:yes stop_codon:yes gene_type:complete
VCAYPDEAKAETEIFKYIYKMKKSNQIEINEYFLPKYLSRDAYQGYDMSTVTPEYLVNFKGYQMLVALYQGTQCHIGERCEYYLTDNGKIDKKFMMKKCEGSFMHSVLEGDVAGAIRNGSQSYREILCDAIKERRLEI